MTTEANPDTNRSPIGWPTEIGVSGKVYKRWVYNVDDTYQLSAQWLIKWWLIYLYMAYICYCYFTYENDLFLWKYEFIWQFTFLVCRPMLRPLGLFSIQKPHILSDDNILNVILIQCLSESNQHQHIFEWDLHQDKQHQNQELMQTQKSPSKYYKFYNAKHIGFYITDCK